jgi:hypothetical protein
LWVIEIKPGENSDTRIKPLPSINGRGCYITAMPQRASASIGNHGGMAVTYNRYKFVTVSLLKPPRNGRFNFGGFRSKTATWIQKWFKNPLELPESSGSTVIVFKAETTGVVIEICVK